MIVNPKTWGYDAAYQRLQELKPLDPVAGAWAKQRDALKATSLGVNQHEDRIAALEDAILRGPFG